MISVIVPTLNAANDLGRTLASVDAGIVGEVVVVDGGSGDGSVQIAEAAGARVIASAPGRGVQLKAGGAAATGDWLLFLHGDTRLAPDWEPAAKRFIDSPSSIARAAVFRYRLDDRAPVARLLERVVDWRTRWLKLPYGDQGLLISRAFYRELGGYKPLPLMEDVDLIRRIGGARLEILDADAITSAAKYRASGYGRRLARNITCITLYYLGVPPRRIARLYDPAGKR